MANFTFTKKVSVKGNLEMRTDFGSRKAAVLTYVNGHFYVNLYNNNRSNPGRISFTYQDYGTLVSLKEVWDRIQPMMVQEHNELMQHQPMQQSTPSQQQSLGQRDVQHMDVESGMIVEHNQLLQHQPMQQNTPSQRQSLGQRDAQHMDGESGMTVPLTQILMPPPTYVAEPIKGHKRRVSWSNEPPAKKMKLEEEEMENWDPMSFFKSLH